MTQQLRKMRRLSDGCPGLHTVEGWATAYDSYKLPKLGQVRRGVVVVVGARRPKREARGCIRSCKKQPPRSNRQRSHIDQFSAKRFSTQDFLLLFVPNKQRVCLGYDSDDTVVLLALPQNAFWRRRICFGGCGKLKVCHDPYWRYSIRGLLGHAWMDEIEWMVCG